MSIAFGGSQPKGEMEMKTTAAMLILIVNLWNLTNGTPLLSIFDSEDLGGSVTAQQDPPDDGGVIFLPPPRY
jgi:hypothetical protein